MSVTLTLEDEIDLSRGDMLVSPDEPPSVATQFRRHGGLVQRRAAGARANLSDQAQRAHVARESHGHRLPREYETLEQDPANELKMNDIAAVDFEAVSPLFFDPYDRNRITGSFILIDPLSNATVGAAMIRSAIPAKAGEAAWTTPVAAEERHRRHGHDPALVLVENRPLLAQYLERALFAEGFEVALVSGANVPADRLGHLLALSQSIGVVLIYATDTISPAEELAFSGLKPKRIFDLETMQLPAEDSAAVSTVLAALQSLRIQAAPAEQKRTNGNHHTFPERTE